MTGDIRSLIGIAADRPLSADEARQERLRDDGCRNVQVDGFGDRPASFAAIGNPAADVFQVGNPGPDPVAIELKLWVRRPDGSTFSRLSVGATGSIVLPAGFDRDFGPITAFRLTISL